MCCGTQLLSAPERRWSKAILSFCRHQRPPIAAADVESPRNLLAACPANTLPDTAVALSVTVLRAKDGTVEAADPANSNPRTSDTRDLRRPLATPLPASTGVELAAMPDAASGLVPC